MRPRPFLVTILGLLVALAALVPGVADARGRDGHRRPGEDAAAWVQVMNERIATVTVFVDGAPYGSIAPEAAASFYLRPGRSELRVMLEGRVLTRTTLDLRPREEARVVVPPWEGRLVVRNETGRAGRLRLDGRDGGLLPAGAERVLVRDPGACRLELVDGGLLLDAGSPSVTPGGRSTFVARPPPVADLVVTNPLPMEVRVAVGGFLRSVPANATVVLPNVSTGAALVEVSRLDGLRIAGSRVSVLPYEGGRFVVPAPAEARVRLVNLSTTPVEVRVDGRVVVQGFARAETDLFLALGRHEVTVRELRSGRILRASVYVGPFEDVELRFDARRGRVEETRRPAPGVDPRHPERPCRHDQHYEGHRCEGPRC